MATKKDSGVTTSHVANQSWYPAFNARIEQMRTYARGWNGYDAQPPSARAIEFGREFLDMLDDANVTPANVSASAIGGVAFAFLSGDVELFVEFLNSGNLFLTHMESDLERELEPIEFTPNEDGIRQLINRIEHELNA
jgi:hypothetical protein